MRGRIHIGCFAPKNGLVGMVKPSIPEPSWATCRSDWEYVILGVGFLLCALRGLAG